MSFDARFVECVFDGGADSAWVIGICAGFLCDGVGGEESDSPDVSRELVGVCA